MPTERSFETATLLEVKASQCAFENATAMRPTTSAFAQPPNVIIENVEVRDSENVGIYLHQHTVGVTIRDSIIEEEQQRGALSRPYGRHHQLITT